MSLRAHKTIIVSLLLIIVATVGVYRVLLQGQLLESDDYQHHAARTANYYLAFKQGQLPPRWAPNLNGGFGYPAFFYTYPGPYAVSSFIHTFGITIQQSVNLTVLLFLALGGVGGFVLARSILFRSAKSARLLSVALGLVYVINPYILLNTFWRGALGEIAFYACIPWLFVGLHQLLQARLSKKNRLVSGLLLSTAALAGAVFSHLLSVAVLAPILVLYVGLQLYVSEQTRKERRTRFMIITAAALLAGLLTAWYWLPAVFERSYIVFNSSQLATIYQEHFVSLATLLSFFKTITSSDFFLEVIQLGPGLVVGVAAAAAALYQNEKHKPQLLFWLASTALAVFLITDTSKLIWDHFSLLQIQQFPWRFIWLTNLGMFWLLLLSVKTFTARWQRVLGIVFVGLTIWSAVAYAQPKGFFSRSDFDWYQSVATGSSFDEFRPVWAKQGYELEQRLQLLDSNKNTAKESSINIVEWTGSQMRYTVTANTPVTAVQKTLYFPGWEATINGKSVQLSPDNPHYPGLVTVPIPSGEHQVTVRFAGSTPIRTLGKYAGVIGLFGLAAIVVILKRYNPAASA